jgi:hypothetical protein
MDSALAGMLTTTSTMLGSGMLKDKEMLTLERKPIAQLHAAATLHVLPMSL